MLLCGVVLATFIGKFIDVGRMRHHIGKFTTSYQSLVSDLGSGGESNPLNANANDSSAIQVHFRQNSIPFDCSIVGKHTTRPDSSDSSDLLRLLHLWQACVPYFMTAHVAIMTLHGIKLL